MYQTIDQIIERYSAEKLFPDIKFRKVNEQLSRLIALARANNEPDICIWCQMTLTHIQYNKKISKANLN